MSLWARSRSRPSIQIQTRPESFAEGHCTVPHPSAGLVPLFADPQDYERTLVFVQTRRSPAHQRGGFPRPTAVCPAVPTWFRQLHGFLAYHPVVCPTDTSNERPN